MNSESNQPQGEAPKEHRVVITSTSEQARMDHKAVGRFWLRYIGWGSILMFPGIIIVITIRFIITEWCSKIENLLLGLSTFWILWMVLGYFSCKRRFLTNSERNNPAVELVFGENAISIHLDDDRADLSWEWIKALWEFPDCWMLLIGKRRFMPIASALLDADTKRFIEAQVLKQRGRVLVNPGLGFGLIFWE